MSSSIATTDDKNLDAFLQYVDDHQKLYIDRLRDAVAIPSISAELDDHLVDINKMMDWASAHIDRLGGTYELRPNPVATEAKRLPPILTASFVTDPALKTVCVYGHLDVQPASKEDGWDTDPFVLTEKDGKLYGRGSTDDKGPAISWINVIEAHQDLGIALPVNIKILFEGMEENGSEGMFEFIKAEAAEGLFLWDVDFFCISDNYWIGTRKPCLTYGLRGMAYFQMSVTGCGQDLHSGVLGGAVHEAMTDLVQLMACLVDSNGTILVPGVNEMVKPVTAEEEALYDELDFELDEFVEENKIVTGKLLFADKKSLLMHRWRYPSLSLHGIEGAFAGPGAKTVIPACVIGKFSLRLVPDQDPTKVEKLVKDHLEATFSKLGSPNILKIDMLHGAKAWLSSPKHPNYEAAAAAIEKVYGVKPDYTREGGSIPLTSALEDSTGMNVLLLPVGACDDMAHSQNEKYNVTNLMSGIKVLGLYLHELGKINGPKPSSCRCVPLTAEELMVPGAFMKGFRCKCEM